MATLMLLSEAGKDALYAAAVGAGDPGWKYLESFDLEANNGWGDVKLTTDPAKAMRFDSLEVAMTTWRLESKTRPLRPDGRPNRPLTAYHATFEEAPT